MSAPPIQSRLLKPGGRFTGEAEGPALGAAFVGGVRRHPILGPAFDSAANLFGYDRKMLERLELQVGRETTSEKLAGLVGELGPDFLLGAGVYGAGRAAGVGLLRAAAAGRKAGQLGQVAARAARDSALAAGRLGELRQLPVPWAETLSRAAGGQAAVAGFFGGETLLETGSPRQALETAALSLAVGGALEGVPAALGSLTGRGRALRLNQEELRSKAVSAPLRTLLRHLETGKGGSKEAKKVSKSIPFLTGRLQHLEERLDLALGVSQTAGNLVKRAELDDALAKLPEQIQQAELRLRRAEVLRDTSKRLLGESGADIPLITERPFVPKGFNDLMLQVSRRVGRTPESLMGRLGASAARFFSAYQHTEMATNLGVTTQGEMMMQVRRSAMKALGVSVHEKSPRVRELLWRSQHEWGKLHSSGRRQTVLESAESVEEFLMHPPPEVAKLLPGGKGLPRAQAEEFTQSLGLTQLYLDVMGERLENTGVFLRWADEDYLAMGNSHYWTHLGDPGLDDVTHGARLLAYNQDDELLTRRMIEGAEEAGWLPSQHLRRERGPGRKIQSRIGRFSSFDYARSVPGTGWEKLRAGLPIHDDPFDAAARYLKAGERRVHAVELAGPNGELIDVVADAVEAEVSAAARQEAEAAARAAALAGKTAPRPDRVAIAEGRDTANLFKNITDDLLDHPFYNEAVNRLMRTVTSANVWSKLSLGSIAQATQFQNTAYVTGVGASLKGFRQLLNKTAREEATIALAIPHMASRAVAGMLDAGAFSQRSERFAEFMLKWTGFEPLEKILRVHSYFSGNAIFRDTLLRASAGKLRGTNLDAAFRRMADLGVDLKAEVAALRREGPQAYFASERVQNLVERVGYRAAQRAQFIPAKSRKPTLWDHPMGRVAFQFKTFAMGQARLVKDTVLTEAAAGNVKPLALWMSLTPLSGAFIVNAKDLFRDRPLRFNDHPVAQAAELFMSAGGFGLAGDMFYGALNGDIPGWALGPTASQVADVLEGLAARDSDALLRSGTRLPLVRLATGVWSASQGAAELTEEKVREYLDATSPSSGRPVTMDLGAARLRAVQEKLKGGGGL